MKIALASDHAGYSAKLVLAEHLKNKGIEIVDFGCHSENSCDYADFAHPLAEAIEKKEYDFGFALCGSGNGINITANKHQGIRAALCWLPELAVLARSHNDANICSIPARFISYAQLTEIADSFLKTEFEGGRHALRVAKISCQ